MLHNVPPPRLIRSDERRTEWILLLRPEQMAALASCGLSLREIGQRLDTTKGGGKAGLWRARHANRSESKTNFCAIAAGVEKALGRGLDE